VVVQLPPLAAVRVVLLDQLPAVAVHSDQTDHPGPPGGPGVGCSAIGGRPGVAGDRFRRTVTLGRGHR